MNRQTIRALPTSELRRFTELYSATELENAYMDGECSQAEGDRRYKEAIYWVDAKIIETLKPENL